MGENQGGINVLRSPKWGEIQDKYISLLDEGKTAEYWKKVTDEFWETVNKPWLDEAMARGDALRFVSDPRAEKAVFVTDRTTDEFILEDGKRIKSIFGREVDYLEAHGYEFRADGTAVKVN